MRKENLWSWLLLIFAVSPELEEGTEEQSWSPEKHVVSVYHNKWQTIHGLFLSPLKFEGFDFGSNESGFVGEFYSVFPPQLLKSIWQILLCLQGSMGPHVLGSDLGSRNSARCLELSFVSQALLMCVVDFDKTSVLLSFFLRNQVELFLWDPRKFWPAASFSESPNSVCISRTRVDTLRGINGHSYKGSAHSWWFLSSHLLGLQNLGANWVQPGKASVLQCPSAQVGTEKVENSKKRRFWRSDPASGFLVLPALLCSDTEKGKPNNPTNPPKAFRGQTISQHPQAVLDAWWSLRR